jgi:hypothetical protein
MCRQRTPRIFRLSLALTFVFGVLATGRGGLPADGGAAPRSVKFRTPAQCQE